MVQVNGKLRDRIEAPADISEEAARELALSSARVRPHLEGKELRKSVYVPGGSSTSSSGKSGDHSGSRKGKWCSP